MILAAIVPYVRRQGFTGAEVLIGTTPAILRSIEIGRLVDRAEPRLVPRKRGPPGVLTMERQITDADVDGAVSEILVLLRLHHVTHAALERLDGDGVEAERSRRIACAVAAALMSAGIATAAPAIPVPSSQPSPVSQLAEPAIDIIASEYCASTPKSGLRIVGVDPGSHWVACVVAERDELKGLRHVSSRVFEVGRKVLLGKPKTIQRKNGSVFVQTHRREILDADIGKLLRDVLAWLDPLDVDQAIIERASFFRTSGDGVGARAAGLARAQWIGGEIAGVLRTATYEQDLLRDRVQTVSSALWRRVAKRAAKFPLIVADEVGMATLDPRMWRAGVVAAFGGTLPAASGEHIIDAAGCVLWAVAKPAPRAPRPPGAPRAKRVRVRSSRDSNAARAGKLAAAKAERVAMGCSCGRRHVKACPMFQPMRYGKERQ